MRSTGPRVPGLDGLRALAVLAVLGFHAYPPWLPGGYLGVDMFFVVSGFLITRQLLTGGGRLGDFHRRRARRLLPALAAVLTGVAFAGAALWRGQSDALRGDLLASVGYVTNWWFIARDRPYFIASGQPSPLLHLGPVAVEAQFCVLWSVVLVLLLRWRRGRSTGAPLVGAVAFGLALVSTALMGWLAVPDDVPYRVDSARLYLGSDTHAMGLFVGAGLAAFWPSVRRMLCAIPRLVVDLVAVTALAAVVWSLARIDPYQPGMYRGGFLAFSLLTMVLMAAVAVPGGRVGVLLETPVPRWIGQRGYELYLWHWPVFVAIGSTLNDDPWAALGLLPLRLLVTVVLAELTYRYLTPPIWHPRRSASVPIEVGVSRAGRR